MKELRVSLWIMKEQKRTPSTISAQKNKGDFLIKTVKTTMKNKLGKSYMGADRGKDLIDSDDKKAITKLQEMGSDAFKSLVLSKYDACVLKFGSGKKTMVIDEMEKLRAKHGVHIGQRNKGVYWTYRIV